MSIRIRRGFLPCIDAESAVVAILAMAFGLAFASALFGQTRPHYSQIQGAPAGWVERAHCPGPSFTLTSDVEVAVGSSWTTNTPCNAIMSVTLPVDPVHVEIVRGGCTVRLNGLLEDDIYVWIAQGNGIRVGTTQVTKVTGTCYLMPLGTPRLFPTNVQVVGVLLVRGGKFVLPLVDVIGQYQLSTNGFALSAAVTDAGAIFSPSGAQLMISRAQQQQVPLALSTTQQQQINERLSQVEGRLMEVQAELQATPASDRSVGEMSARIEQVSMQASEMVSMANNTASQTNEMVYQMKQDVAEIVRRMRVPVPVLPAPPCEEGTWAADTTRYYRCWDFGWHVFKVE